MIRLRIQAALAYRTLLAVPAHATVGADPPQLALDIA